MFWGKTQQIPLPANDMPYRAFTRQFDREVSAGILRDEIRAGTPLSAATLREIDGVLRAGGPARVRAGQRAITFEARLADGHALGDRPCVTLLVDHSGSMKDARALAAAMTADIVSNTLLRQSVPVEVLGFTTTSWHGGQSRMLWRKQGRPAKPGRLCDLLHIVYRDAAETNQNWTANLPLMASPDVLKENIDGEALLWAHGRAMARDVTGWVCILISDGTPVDDATILANGPPENNWYLLKHLGSVVAQLNAEPATRLGYLALDEVADMQFRALQRVTVLEDTALRAFDLLEDLIWPQPDAN
jgi:cobaltochelatase CobT